jgi:TniQ
MNPLPRTPAPRPDEGFFAYLLRLSQANAYLTPRYIAYTANVARTHWMQPYPAYPAMNLAPLIGGHEAVLKRISYRTEVGHSIRYKLLDHEIGRKHGGLLRLMAPAFCVQCVKEDGYIRAFWDLAAAVACPRHRRPATHQCATCHQPLKWYRPGILRCQCNGDLGMPALVYVDTLLVDLMKVLEAKVDRRPLAASVGAAQLPLSILEDMPLADLLRVIDVFGNVACPEETADKCGPPGVGKVGAAARLLSQWPSGMNQWLQSIKATQAADPMPVPVRRIYSVLFRKRQLSAGLRHLKEGFLELCSSHWPTAMIAEPAAKRPARALRAESAPSRQRTLQREASATLGIPTSTLHILRDRGVYGGEVQHGKRHTWRQDDVRAFRGRMLTLADDVPAGAAAVKLETLLGLKFRNQAAKADLVEAVLWGKLPVVGLDGDKPSDLLLNRREADRWIQETRVREGGDTYSFPQAARQIGLDSAVIPAALKAGLLEGTKVGELIRIPVASVARFRELYVAVVHMAVQMKRSVRRLTRFIERNGLKVIYLARIGSGITQPVILREDQSLIKEMWNEEWVKEASRKRVPPADMESDRMATLTKYLERMKARGKKLPRHGGKLHRSAIARACGFHRNDLYAREQLTHLLVEADLAERKQNGLELLKPIQILGYYLAECHRTRKSIPRTPNGKPNKLAIATACGIDRNIFYKDAVARRLIDQVA